MLICGGETRVVADEKSCERAMEVLGMPDTSTWHVGAARVSLLNAGDMRTKLADELAVPEAEWRPQYAALFEQPRLFPSLSVLVECQGVRLLVDANDYRATVLADSEYAIAGYAPPPPIPSQLASLGVRPEEITQMVITHAHWDHFAGTTMPSSDGGYAPTFPRARYYLGAADWRDDEQQAAQQDADGLEARTLGVLHARGVLQTVAEPLQLADGITILPAPGETPGHLIVRVRSEGETLFILGDLFHDAVEVEHPEWMVSWADAATMRETREWVCRQALAENALLVAAHIATVGRIERTEVGRRWRDA
jgi:glyoxylase-like metal-dependent hydrolase (beta-lactamase superfamily II)